MLGHGRSRLVALGLTGLLALSIPGLAGAAAPPHPSPLVIVPVGLDAWAYGAYKTVNVSGSGSNLNGSYEYSIRAYFGYEVILNQTNLSSGLVQVSVQRIEAANFYADYCRPTCASPLITANITYRALEVGIGVANLTDSGSVTESGTAVAAVGLVGLYDRVGGNITTIAHTAFHGSLGSTSSTSEFTAQSNATIGISFAPTSLGLYPTTLTSGATWNSSASFTAVGSWSLSFAYSRNPLVGPGLSGHGGGTGLVSRNGSVDLSGSALDAVTLASGQTVTPVALHSFGPFSIREGLLFLPATADLFGASNQGTFAPVSSGGQTVGTAAVDVRGSPSGHLGLQSSSTTFESESTSAGLPSSAVTPTPAAGLLSLAGTGPDATGPITVQAQPESVSQAAGMSNCLQNGNCPIPGASPRFGGFVIAGIAGLAVAVFLVGLIVARRQTPPPPPRPHARLYPPLGGAEPSTPMPTPRPPTTPLPPTPPRESEPDPLGNLW